jgi:hypothetical protein
MEEARAWKETTAGSQPETGVREGMSPPQERL